MNFLLDTNVLSELRKGPRADANVRRWFSGVEDPSIFVSVLVLGEIRMGIERLRLRDPRSANILDRWLSEVADDHSERILSIDQAVAEVWGRFNSPDPLPVVDSLLAATAQVHDLTVVTRNTADISRTGVPCLDPFEPTG